MSHHCSECVVYWWSYQADHGRCPTCGANTVPSEDAVSDDADTLYRIACAEAERRDAYAHFELYYGAPEQDRRAA